MSRSGDRRGSPRHPASKGETGDEPKDGQAEADEGRWVQDAELLQGETQSSASEAAEDRGQKACCPAPARARTRHDGEQADQGKEQSAAAERRRERVHIVDDDPDRAGAATALAGCRT